MTDRRFFLLVVIVLVAMIILAILGEFFSSASLLFNVLLTIIGLIAGYLTSMFFAERSERQNLGKYAIAGHRLSLDIHDGLADVRNKIEELSKNLNGSTTINGEATKIILELVSSQIALIQRFSLSANTQWREMLPLTQLEELNNREQLYDLGNHEAKITKRKQVIKVRT